MLWFMAYGAGNSQTIEVQEALPQHTINAPNQETTNVPEEEEDEDPDEISKSHAPFDQ
jgi:hypothetical protein